MQSTSEMTPTETLIENAERQRRWLRRGCWAGIAFVVVAILFAIGNPLFIRWQLRQHGWRIDGEGRAGLPNWAPDAFVPWFGRIESAYLSDRTIRLNDLAKLRRFPHLKYIGVRSTDVSDSALLAISQLPEVTEVSIERARLDSSGLRHLAALSSLKSVHFHEMSLPEAIFEELSGCTQLVSFSVLQSSFSDESLRHLSRLSRLNHLGIYDCRMADLGIEHISHCGNLESINLHRTDITDAGIPSLSRLTKLHKLSLENCRLTDAGADQIVVNCPNLEALWIRDAPMTDAALNAFARHRKLQQLELSSIPITDDGILRLKSCSNLKYLFLLNTGATSAGATELRNALPTTELLIR